MRIVIRRTLPSFYELSFNEEYKLLNDFYKTLDLYRNEYVSFNENNVRKIIEFFNNAENCENISKEIIKEDGLTDTVVHNGLSVFEIKTTQNSSIINQIIIYHALDIIDKNFENHYKKVNEEFYQFLKNKLKGENVSKYSLYSIDLVRCINLKKYIKNKNMNYNIRLEADYTLERTNYDHFEKFRNERCIYSCKISNEGRMNITISKSY